MKLNKTRVSRYLELQKKINDYLLKLSSKNRDAMIKLAEARHYSFQSEQSLRDLLNLIAKENIDG